MPVRFAGHGFCLLNSALSVLLGSILTQPAAAAEPRTLEWVVAPDGRADNPGTWKLPLSLEGARDRLRAARLSGAAQARPARIRLRGGSYFLQAPLELDARDSGTRDRPVVFEAVPGEQPRLVGGVALPASAFRPVGADDPNEARLDGQARAHILVADLSAYAGALGLRSFPDAFVEVFLDGRPMTLARYPKAVAPEAVELAPAKPLRVEGEGLEPDVTGDYRPVNLTFLGRPVYQLEKGGELWSIAWKRERSGWELSNRSDLGGRGRPASWSAFDGLALPAGRLDEPQGGARGKVFLEAADGSTAEDLGQMLIQGVPSATGIRVPEGLLTRWTRPGQPKGPVFFKGFGYYCWFQSRIRVTGFHPAERSIELEALPPYGLRRGQPFFLENILEELSDPGEFYLDRDTLRLYLRPYGDQVPAQAILPTLGSVLTLRDVRFLRMEGIAFEAARADLVKVLDSRGVTFDQCLFRNAAGYGLILGGSGHRVERCQFQGTGRGGIWVAGGDRRTLEPSGTVIRGCAIQGFGRLAGTGHPGIRVEQLEPDESSKDVAREPVGVAILHNEIHHGPSHAIMWRGNDHLIQGNHLHHVCQWMNDAGAINTYGRDWGGRGTVIRGNLIDHDGGPFGTFICGVYLDGCASGATIEGNLIHEPLGSYGVLHSGGRDVTIRHNILAGSRFGLKLENAGVRAIAPGSQRGWDLPAKLGQVGYRSEPWRKAYPELAALPDDWQQLQGSHWLQPEGCRVDGNAYWGPAGGQDWIQDASNCYPPGTHAGRFMQIVNNVRLGAPPFPGGPAPGGYALPPDSPVFQIPGFPPFPGLDVAGIGIPWEPLVPD